MNKPALEIDQHKQIFKAKQREEKKASDRQEGDT